MEETMIKFKYLAIISALAAAGCAGNGPLFSLDSGPKNTANSAKPSIGLGDYTRSHAVNKNPPDRWGGAIAVIAEQENGATQWVLPGPRSLDPTVFGTPNNPVGWDQAPFPLIGVPTELRLSRGGEYTIVNHATPFSDWREIGLGSVKMTIVDQTAIDGARTKDRIDFVATFSAPDKSHSYKVVVNKPLPHGFGYPTFGGVVTDHLMHGATGIGTRLMPTEYIYASFWGAGDIYVDGRLTNHDQIVHVMVGEGVRGSGWKLSSDKGVHGQGVVMHLMVPPYKVSPTGPVMAPLRSGYIPFPAIKKHMMKAKSKIESMSKDQQVAMMPKLAESKALMEKTKAHVQEQMADGKMFGQPFFHVMFGNVKYQVDK